MLKAALCCEELLQPHAPCPIPHAAYGKVYKGRWQGAVVAVKVVEHHVAEGETSAASREPLLW